MDRDHLFTKNCLELVSVEIWKWKGIWLDYWVISKDQKFDRPFESRRMMLPNPIPKAWFLSETNEYTNVLSFKRVLISDHRSNRS